MTTWLDILFCLIFLSQIFLISSYLPGKILHRMQSVVETYPPAEYPKLYPQPIEHYKVGHLIYKIINRCLFFLGFVVLFLIITVVDHSTFADDGFISEAWPMGYGVLQFIPLILLEASEFNQFKLMREANSATLRKADLHPRRFSDFVSPITLALAAILFFAVIFFDLYLHDFTIQWGHDTVQRALLLILTNLFFAAVAAWNLYGRKMNPYQASADRSRQIKVTLSSMVYVSMAVSLFTMMQAADSFFGLDPLDAITISLYLQIVSLLSIGHILRSQRLEDIDFDVYKDSSVVT